ncbi:hypothetical protein SASPL_148880 [Salvia splendens]|uniref:P-type Ca(2+) transporter n=1 Tax=Salvia splendens TaxID=180675 RepID=A0A8X8WB55_SALSN|nr:hypothetical protein SASPL_148880 [Salvia splendens]
MQSMDLSKFSLLPVTIVVVAVPEGLPLAVTLTLAYSMKKMMADKALVRRLSACETMGSATTICSDKTGTLTLNRMTVVEAYVCGKKTDSPDNKSLLPPRMISLLIEGISQNTTGSVFLTESMKRTPNPMRPIEPANEPIATYPSGSNMRLIDSSTALPGVNRKLQLIGHNSYLFQNVKHTTDLSCKGGAMEISGSPTEKAILQWALGMDFGASRSDSAIIHAFPFNSEKKRGGVALKLVHNILFGLWRVYVFHVSNWFNLLIEKSFPRSLIYSFLANQFIAVLNCGQSNSEIRVHWKGAAEIVLASCTHYIDADDNVVEMDEDKLSLFREAIEDMAKESLRCVAIAYRTCGMDEVPTTEEELENWQLPEGDLILLAIVGIKDPCRPGVRDAVQLCVNAGVKVRMVTGDNLQTARAIALECGILGSNADATEPNLIEGKTFRNMTESQRLEVADRISVMGRSSPNDKLLLVQALRRKEHVVAVTGDGTNDAPALHEADIGLAMGIQGTEVAKESSDITILDDNFTSVVKVVRWGRSVYANIQKFIQFQLTVNVAALVINVAAAVSSGNVPLNAVQLLWVNLIMDTLGALALATEPPTDHLMGRPPVGRREPLITNIMWRNLLIQALYQVTVLLVLNFRGKNILNLKNDTSDHAFKVKNTLISNAFVFCQVRLLLYKDS